MNDPTMLTWKIDPGHSAIQFKVKHLAVANVSGAFTAFNGAVQTDRDDFDGAQVHIDIDVNSLSTNNELRDTHLKSDSFFAVQQFPKLTFRGMLHKVADDYALAGELTIRDTSKPIKLDVAFTGTGKGRFGDNRAGFDVSGRLNRTDFGLTWSMLTETGNLVVGEDIKLSMDIELIKEEVEAALSA